MADFSEQELALVRKNLIPFPHLAFGLTVGLMHLFLPPSRGYWVPGPAIEISRSLLELAGTALREGLSVPLRSEVLSRFTRRRLQQLDEIERTDPDHRFEYLHEFSSRARDLAGQLLSS
jgi:hypothetical protein